MNFDFKSVTDFLRRSTYTTLAVAALATGGCAKNDAKISVGGPSGDQTAQQKPGPIPASSDTALIAANLEEIARLARTIGLNLQRPAVNFRDGCTEYRVIPNTQGVFLTGNVNCINDDTAVPGQATFRRESLGRDIYTANAIRGEMRSERIFFVRNLTDISNFVQRGEVRRVARFNLPQAQDELGENEIDATLTFSSIAAPTQAGKSGERLDVATNSTFFIEAINTPVLWAKGSRVRLDHRPDQNAAPYNLKVIELQALNDVTFTTGRCPHAVGQFKALIAINEARPTGTTVTTTATGIKIGTGQEIGWSPRCLDY